jgi:hypothetical protein
MIPAAISAGRAVGSARKALEMSEKVSANFVPQLAGIVCHVILFSAKMLKSLDVASLLLV